MSRLLFLVLPSFLPYLMDFKYGIVERVIDRLSQAADTASDLGLVYKAGHKGRRFIMHNRYLWQIVAILYRFYIY